MSKLVFISSQYYGWTCQHLSFWKFRGSAYNLLLIVTSTSLWIIYLTEIVFVVLVILMNCPVLILSSSLGRVEIMIFLWRLQNLWFIILIIHVRTSFIFSVIVKVFVWRDCWRFLANGSSGLAGIISYLSLSSICK
jgi:hypothetical protein